MTVLVQELLQEMAKDPIRFRDRGGYDDLVQELEGGRGTTEVNQALTEGSVNPGDLLWAICELVDVAPFTSGAVPHLTSDHSGTAAYAIEVVLRGASTEAEISTAFRTLEVVDPVVRAHAAQTLAGEGLGRLLEVVQLAGVPWGERFVEAFSGPARREAIGDLVASKDSARQVVGVALVGLACEVDPSVSSVLQSANEDWIREFGRSAPSPPPR